MGTDVLVVGCGPAGAAAARRAALNGLSVTLADAAEFPRDKACGDALIPDAQRALAALGLASRIHLIASRASRLRVYAPGGRCVVLRGDSWLVPRRDLDDTLRQAAVEAGAVFRAPLKVVAPILDGSAVAGAWFRGPEGRAVEIRARQTILATGAAAGPLLRFGVCRRPTPSATAARVYVDLHPAAPAERTDLVIAYDASLFPGYGWLFPGPRGFNVGVGWFYDAPRLPVPTNLRILLERFLERFPPAARLMRYARSVTSLEGAPLRTAMTGAELSRPGLLVVGDAAGLAYSYTGEGIGKALESGLLAADVMAEGDVTTSSGIERISRAYAERLSSSFAGRFRAYRRAQQWASSPLRANLVAWRASSGRFARRELEAMFADLGDPDRLFSARGLVRSLVD